jgi:hypothetical protein
MELITAKLSPILSTYYQPRVQIFHGERTTWHFFSLSPFFRTVIMGRSGPKISSFIIAESSGTSSSSVGAILLRSTAKKCFFYYYDDDVERRGDRRN